jgi:hypothetical protein
MTHHRLRTRLGPYLEGELSGAARRRLEAHIEGCAACREELAALGRTVALLRGLPAESPPPGLAERIVARVQEAPRGGLGGWLERHGSLVGAAVPLAAGLVVAVALLPRLEVTVRLGPGLRAPGPAATETARPAPPPAPPLRVAGATASPLPPRAACVDERAATPACAGWHAWMLGLAMREPSVFVAEVEGLPSEQKERWIRDLSSFAADAGAASLLATELRASGDPRAARLAPRFERVGAFSGRR